MPRTAFSAHYARELDPEQLVALAIGGEPGAVDAATDLSSEMRSWVRSDVVCSSCSAKGAQIVRTARGQTKAVCARQAHFRFVSPTGEDAHHMFCEFRGDAAGHESEALVDLGRARTAETRWVRDLVCRGIENGIFDQTSIRAMRQWFFDLKANSRTRIALEPEAFDWISRLQRHPSFLRWPFYPVHAEMPGFKWDLAAVYQFTEENLPLFGLVRGAGIDGSVRNRAKALVMRYDGQEVFDHSALRPYYEKTLLLGMFIARNSDFAGGKGRTEKIFNDGAPVPLLALCALLLFISDWDINVAIGTSARLFATRPAGDQTLGNVIGLNPFHDYAAWKLVALASTVASQSPRGFDYHGQLAAIEDRLRHEHVEWKTGGG